MKCWPFKFPSKVDHFSNWRFGSKWLQRKWLDQFNSVKKFRCDVRSTESCHTSLLISRGYNEPQKSVLVASLEFYQISFIIKPVTFSYKSSLGWPLLEIFKDSCCLCTHTRITTVGREGDHLSVGNILANPDPKWTNDKLKKLHNRSKYLHMQVRAPRQHLKWKLRF